MQKGRLSGPVHVSKHGPRPYVTLTPHSEVPSNAAQIVLLVGHKPSKGVDGQRSNP